MEKEIRKLIDLPIATVEQLTKQAKEKRMLFKAYAESVLIKKGKKP